LGWLGRLGVVVGLARFLVAMGSVTRFQWVCCLSAERSWCYEGQGWKLHEAIADLSIALGCGDVPAEHNDLVTIRFS
jgi:hypothetical protein